MRAIMKYDITKNKAMNTYPPMRCSAIIRALAFAAFTRDHASRTNHTFMPPTTTNRKPSTILAEGLIIDRYLLERRHFAIHFDCALGLGERVVELGIPLESFDGVRQQAPKPAKELQFGLRHVSSTRFEVFTACVHRSNHNFVSENELQVDAVGGHFNFLI